MEFSQVLATYRAYYRHVVELKCEVDLLLDNLALNIGLDRDGNASFDPFKIHLAVDFRDVYLYLSPLSSQEDDKHEYDFENGVTASECMFSGFFPDLQLILLPHYEAEHWTTLYSEGLRNDRKMEILTDALLQKFESNCNEVFNAPSIRKVLSKPFSKLNRKEKEGFFDYLGKNVPELLRLSALTYRDPIQTSKFLLDTGRLIPFSQHELYKLIDETSTERSGEKVWFRLLNDLRQGNFWRMSNYVDAQGLAYTWEINKKLRENNKNEIILLLSSPKALHKVVKTAIEENQIGEISLNNRYRHPIVAKPSLFITYLQFCQSKTDHLSTFRFVQNARKLLVDFLKHEVDYEKAKAVGVDVNNFTEFYSWANERLPKVAELIAKWRNLELFSKEPSLLDEINETFLLRKPSLLSKFEAKHFIQLRNILEILKQDSFQKFDLPAAIKMTLKGIATDRNKIQFKKFMLLQRFANTRSPKTSYMIDFSNSEVREIYSNIIVKEEFLTSELLKKSIDKLYKLLFEHENPPAEAKLLYAYFLSKEKDKNDEALSVLQEINVDDLDTDSQNKVTFVENMIRCGKDDAYIKTAVSKCDELIKKDSKNPRYYLQKGFLIWRGLRRVEWFPFQRSDVLKNWEKSWNYAKEQGIDNVARVALADLALFYFEEGNYTEFEIFFMKLRDYQKDIAVGPVWAFVKALNQWVLAKHKDDFQDRNTCYNKAKDLIDQALEMFDNPFYKEMVQVLIEEMTSKGIKV